MKIEVKVPSVGESVREALLAEWYRKDGDFVKKDDVIFVIETDKVTLEVSAEADGVLKIAVPAGETVPVETVVATIDEEARPAAGAPEVSRGEDAPAAARRMAGKEEVERGAAPSSAQSREPAPKDAPSADGEGGALLSPSIRSLIEEKNVDLSRLQGTGPGGRITKGDILLYLESSEPDESVPVKPLEPGRSATPAAGPKGAGGREAFVAGEPVTREPMSRIRRRIAERLLESKRNTAMLTTFNEIDMSAVQAIRSRFKDAFRQKHGVSLGMMSFFVKASIAALRDYPELNAFIEGDDIVYHHYYHICIAIGAERGLVTPVIRHADQMGFAELERAIVDYAAKARENRLGIRELEGGSFTITNGGVYGSLLSTPILNPPQSGILGMHKIEDRPVAIGGQIVIRPMMYVALSYDHRIVDGRAAVSFLKRIKEIVETPERIMLEI